MSAAPVWKCTVDFGAGAVDITDHCSGFERERAAHKNLRPTVNQARLTVTDLVTANQLLAGDNDLPVVITKDATAWFTGQIRPTYDVTMTSHMQSAKVVCVDDSIDLKKTIDETFVWASYSVCDTSTPATSIVHQLLVKAGFALGDMSLTDILVTITKYSVEQSDDRVFWNEISDLLYDYGYTLDRNYSGVFVMHDLHPPALSTTRITDDEIGQPFRTKRNRQRWEAARVQWFPVDTAYGVLVFSDRTGGDSDNQMSVALANGDYYPEGAGTDTIYSVYRYDDAKILDVSNEVVLWSATGTVSKPTESFGINRAEIAFVGGVGGGVLTRYDIRGDVTFRDLTKKRREVVYKVVGTDRILKHEVRFIEVKAHAEQLASDLANYYDFAKLEYSWEVVDHSASVAVMDEFNIDSDAQNIDINARIISIREDEYGNRFVIAEGISAYILQSTSTQDVILSPPVDDRNQVDDLLPTLVDAETLGGGAWGTATWDQTLGGAAWDEGVLVVLGGLRWSDDAVEVAQDLIVEDGTIHAADIQVVGDDGRLIEIDADDGFVAVDGTYQERIIQIGTGAGILATDNAGEVIHDIPDAPVQSETLYLGHLIYINEPHSGNNLIFSSSIASGTWHDLSCLVLNNSNAKGGLFKVYCTGWGTATAHPFVRISLRPKGTTWDRDPDDACPSISHSNNFSSAIGTNVYTEGLLICPIGTDNKIQFYFSVLPIDGGYGISVTQLGVFI